MRAYKFRSAAQIEFAFDILLNRRLYCADWQHLNDPMEGLYAYTQRANAPDAQQRVIGIREAKRQYRIASLAGTFDCHLLWAHYAGGFDGLAIEINLPDNDPNVRPINYRGVFASVDMDQVRSEDAAARAILFSKYREWEYEREIRVLHDQCFYDIERPIRRVIAGHRMGQALFDALHLICDTLDIEVCRLGIGDEGLDADRVPGPRLASEQGPRSTRRRNSTGR